MIAPDFMISPTASDLTKVVPVISAAFVVKLSPSASTRPSRIPKNFPVIFFIHMISSLIVNELKTIPALESSVLRQFLNFGMICQYIIPNQASVNVTKSGAKLKYDKNKDSGDWTRQGPVPAADRQQHSQVPTASATAFIQSTDAAASTAPFVLPLCS